MLDKLKFGFVKVSLYSAIAQVIRFLYAFLSNKLLAIYAGTAGMALLGQFSNIFSILQAISGAGVQQGLTRYIAQEDSNETKEKIMTASAGLIIIFSGIAIAILLLPFPFLKPLFLSNDLGKNIIWLWIPALPTAALATWILAIVNGEKDYKTYIRIQIVSTLFALPISVYLIIQFQIKGAISAMVINALMPFFIAAFYKSNQFRFITFRWKLIKEWSPKLLKYSLMAACSMIAFPFTQMFIRKIICDTYNIQEAGIWESCNRISQMLLAILTGAFSTWYLPRLSEIKSEIELSLELKRVLKIVAVFMIFVAIVIISLRKIIPHLLFSVEFESSAHLIPIEVIGDVFRMCSWVLAYIMIAKGMTTLFIITELAYTAIYLILAYILIPIAGAQGAVLAYLLMYVLYFIGMLAIFRHLLFTPKAR